MVFFLGSSNGVAYYFCLMCILHHLFDELLAMAKVLCEYFLFGGFQFQWNEHYKLW
jgi:hypothetical protein